MNLHPAFLGAPLAHRALHDASQGISENGLTAIRAAVASGYGIEIDVQLSADGQAMVFHDDTLDRLTEEAGPVRRRTAAELGAIALNGSTDRIPTLPQVLAAIAGRSALLIEMKDQSQMMGPGPDRLERAVAQALAAYDGPAAVMSFNTYAVAAFGAVAPDVPRGLTTCAYAEKEWQPLGPDRLSALKAIADFDPTGACFISHDRADLASPSVAAIKSRGVPVLCWTVRSPVQEATARRVADNITFEGYRPPLDPR